jgi:hypothetical protein
MAERNRADAYFRIDNGPEDQYRKTRVYIDGTIIPGIRRRGVWRAPIFLTADAERHTVTSMDVGHIDLIAQTYYGIGNEKLWWVIAWVNRIKNPLSDMYIGQQLLIPAVNEIAAALEKVV